MTGTDSDTIVALATPLGRSALAILRISGPQTRPLLGSFFQLTHSRRIYRRRPVLGRVVDANKQAVDQVFLTWFPAPSSYTGEDFCEISHHGNPLISQRLVQVFLEAGARLARPGEFTERAFLNGKLDLSQAEAVRDLIESQTRFQSQLALQQLEGRLSHLLKPLKQELVSVISHLETALEFVEDDVSPDERREVSVKLRAVDDELGPWEASFAVAQLASQGIEVVIAGSPNAGKSSIFNALLNRDRAIVTAAPGTTRDTISETLEVRGLAIRLIDTAGIRSTRQEVEVLGVERSREQVRSADVVLWVVDGSRGLSREDEEVWQLVRDRTTIAVRNKLDLGLKAELTAEMEQCCSSSVTTSALEGEGLERLIGAILDAVSPQRDLRTEPVLVTNLRHQHCLRRARRHVQEAIKALDRQLSEEFVIYDLRKALDQLGQITGEVVVEDILEEIFSAFCIGK